MVGRKRGRPRKTVDITNLPEEPVVDQSKRVIPDGPQGFLSAREASGEDHSEAPAASASPDVPHTDVLQGVNKSFINAFSPGRAEAMIKEHREWVKIEPRVAAIFVPDYESGPATKMIGDERVRYYRPKRIHAEIFNVKTRTLEEEATSAWIPEWEYEALEKKAKGSVRVLERSHA